MQSRALLLSAMTLGLVAGGPTGAGTHVYVAVGEGNQIAHYTADAAGALTLADTAMLPAGPGSLAVDRKKQFLYAALRACKAVAAFAIDPQTGTLTWKATTPVGFNPVYLTTTADRRWLLAASYSEHVAAVLPITPEGTVAATASQQLTLDKNPHSIMADPTGRFVYVPNTGADTIFQYTFDGQRGNLLPNNPEKISVTAGAGPRHFTFHPTLPMVYFVNEKDSTVTAFRRGDAGTLTAVQTLPTLPADYTKSNTCADIHITPDGRWLYASNRGHDSLAGYGVDPETGKLTSLGNFATEKTPREFEIDPAGQSVYSAGQGSGKLVHYRLDGATGRLEPVHTYEVGKGPAWVTAVTLP